LNIPERLKELLYAIAKEGVVASITSAKCTALALSRETFFGGSVRKRRHTGKVCPVLPCVSFV